MPAKNSAGSQNHPRLTRASRRRGSILLMTFTSYRWRGAAALITLITSGLFLQACSLTPPLPRDSTRQVPTNSSPASSAPAITVYFSDPLSGAASGGGAETAFIAAINAAQESIDMAIYNLSLDSVASALISARQRGVEVRLVMESEAMERKQPQRLLGAGIPIVGDQREGLMHNKFTVIDKKEVWTGSMNYTYTSFYTDFNNLLRLESAQATQDYTVEFAEMFDENLFGQQTRAATPYPRVDLGGASLEIYFSPDDGAAKQIARQIRAARESIDIMAYSLTNDSITRALLDQAAAGVTVRGVFDADQIRTNTGGDTEQLRQHGIPVRQDGIDGLLHHKVMIIDGETVITGSFNFTGNADRVNDENVVILHDAKIAALYTANFNTVYENGK